MVKLKYLLIVCYLVSKCSGTFGQSIRPLYGDSAAIFIHNQTSEQMVGPANDPKEYRNVSIPTLQAFMPPSGKVSGTAIIIFPGGAYQMLVYKDEGTLIARYLAAQGITAFVVKYRLPNDLNTPEKYLVPLQDAQQAIKMVRERATQYHLDIHKIGLMGFSAGGHLASTLGTHFHKSYIPNPDSISLRPDFMMLIYPVISMKDGLTHAGSKKNLLGKNPKKENVKLFSNEEQVGNDTPPTYLIHAGDDSAVPVNNSILFYQALQTRSLNAEMHLYPKGNHGFIKKMAVNEWLDPMLYWLNQSGFWTAK